MLGFGSRLSVAYLIHSFIHSCAGQSLPESYQVAGMAPGTEAAPVIKGKSWPPELTF